MTELEALRRLGAVLEHNKKIQELLKDLREYLDEVTVAQDIYNDKLKGIQPRVRRLQGELVSYETKIKKQIPPNIEKAIKNL